MQCFLPHADFEQTFKCLDFRRLGCQRLEALILLQSITKGNGWSGHPASRMWRKYPEALTAYMNACIREWIRRGYKNNMSIMEISKPITFPHWYGDERLHSSHRASLLCKNPTHYGQFGWTEKPFIEYFWPV
jgi:hypothetical protein